VTIQPCYFTLSIIPNKIKRDDLLGLHKPGPSHNLDASKARKSLPGG
jgi:hypothetical protein